MKKALPYILGFLGLLALVIILASAKKKDRVFDERITLKEADKIPYGFYVARHLLGSLFPEAEMYDNKNAPGQWGGVYRYSANQAVFIVARYFNPESDELDEIISFVKRGNYVFIIANDYSYEACRRLHIGAVGQMVSNQTDSLRVNLVPPAFPNSKYSYSGTNYNGHFYNLDNEKQYVLGTNSLDQPNFFKMQTGTGALFLHISPMVFTNYFILHGNNIDYYQKAMSVIPQGIHRILWNEYYLQNRTKEKEPNWLGVLMKYPSFRCGLLTALATLILFALSEMRRRQRIIPVFEKPKNESLDFVETVGRLYYDQKDHHNLAYKMSLYFLEHVRQQYKLSTDVLDEEFTTNLHAKSGYPAKELNQLVGMVLFLRKEQSINEQQLSRFYQQLESFYQNT